MILQNANNIYVGNSAISCIFFRGNKIWPADDVNKLTFTYGWSPSSPINVVGEATNFVIGNKLYIMMAIDHEILFKLRQENGENYFNAEYSNYKYGEYGQIGAYDENSELESAYPELFFDTNGCLISHDGSSWYRWTIPSDLKSNNSNIQKIVSISTMRSGGNNGFYDFSNGDLGVNSIVYYSDSTKFKMIDRYSSSSVYMVELNFI